MYAVIKTGGKQYRVSPGDKVKVEKLPLDKGEKVVFSEVLLAGEGDRIDVGTPVLSDAEVSGTVIDQDRGKKVIAYTYKRRKGFHKKQGHRQDFSLVLIEEIKSGSRVAGIPEDEEEPAQAEAAAEEQDNESEAEEEE